MDGSDKKKYMRIFSYTKAWKVEPSIHHIGKYNLPRPIKLAPALYFGAALLVMRIIVVAVPVLKNIPKTFSYGLIPGGIAYVLTRVSLDGKNPIRYLVGMIRYRMFEKGRYIERFKFNSTKRQREKITWTVGTSTAAKAKPIRLDWSCGRGGYISE